MYRRNSRAMAFIACEVYRGGGRTCREWNQCAHSSWARRSFHQRRKCLNQLDRRCKPHYRRWKHRRPLRAFATSKFQVVRSKARDLMYGAVAGVHHIHGADIHGRDPNLSRSVIVSDVIHRDVSLSVVGKRQGANRVIRTSVGGVACNPMAITAMPNVMPSWREIRSFLAKILAPTLEN